MDDDDGTPSAIAPAQAEKPNMKGKKGKGYLTQESSGESREVPIADLRGRRGEKADRREERDGGEAKIGKKEKRMNIRKLRKSWRMGGGEKRKREENVAGEGMPWGVPTTVSDEGPSRRSRR